MKQVFLPVVPTATFIQKQKHKCHVQHDMKVLCPWHN